MTNTTELTAVKRFEIALKREHNAFSSMLAGSMISPQRFLRAAVTAVEYGQGLDECTPESIMKACKQAAQDGLVLDNKEAALVVFNKNMAKKGQKARWEKHAAYIPMYQGLIKKALASSQVTKLTSRVVRDHDVFRVKYGLNEEIIHEPNFDNPGELKCVYAIAQLADGSTISEIMTRDEVMQAAKASKSGVDEHGNLKGIWKTWEPEMWRKTAIKRLSKYLPIENDEYDQLVNYDNEVNAEPDPVPESKPARTSTAEKIIEAEVMPADDGPAPTPPVDEVYDDTDII